MRGVKVWRNEFGITIFRLHYESDPAKAAGEPIFVPELGMSLSPWAKGEYDRMLDKDRYRQEYEIDFGARQGALIYHLDEEATLEQSFPIPHDWTRIWTIDPHPRKPDASLWGAVDRWNDLWIYRELWPSKIYDKAGNVPEDDNRVTIPEYTEAVLLLESEDNPENQGKREKIYKSVIDYAARAFGQGTSDDPEQPNFQQRYEQAFREFGHPRYFEDAKKDRSVGEDMVNDWLRPMTVDGQKKSRVHIFADKCPELVRQLRTNRHKMLTDAQAAVQDPGAARVDKRNDLADCIRYKVMSNPEYVEDRDPETLSDWEPRTEGIGY